MRRRAQMPSTFTLFAALLLVPAGGLLGCGGDGDDASDGAGGADSGTSAESGDNGVGQSPGNKPEPTPDASAVAPTETTIVVSFADAPPAAASEAASYTITSKYGPLDVLEVALDAATRKATLTTSKQKLGVRYQFTLANIADHPDGLTVEVLAADSARFWATDFANFADYELVANRVAVGEHCVIYLEEGQGMADPESVVRLFDEKVFPVETKLFFKAPDMDENGRIVLLGLDGGNYYGGYFTPVNSLTEEEAQNKWGAHSNEKEMLYLNSRSFHPEVVVPHEFSHLLYNHRHGVDGGRWNYHNEGLAECAVNAVMGFHGSSLSHFLNDPSGKIRQGLSLVDWQYANYDQYAQAYVFWSYLAGQLGGIAGYGQLFDNPGSPSEISQLLQNEIGRDFTAAQLDSLIASHVRASAGNYSFNGVISLGKQRPMANAGSLDLAPFAGTLMPMSTASVDYPGGQGPNIIYAGINDSKVVDLTAPFDVSGGALVVFNTRFDINDFSTEPSGPNLLPIVPSSEVEGPVPAMRPLTDHDLSWLHPPPLYPQNRAELKRWVVAQRFARGLTR